MLKKINSLLIFSAVFFGLSFGAFFAVPNKALAATLSINPAAGTFTVGSTFEVSIYLNTEGKSINAVQTSLGFPPDKLQLVSPSAGKSVIGVWTAQPSVNNQTGRVDLQGGIPGGINVSSGLVTTLTFRVKSVGSATLRFLDDSKVLLHDGQGSNVLTNTSSGIYNLVLPPPAGPVVVSQTHPDQNLWYGNKTVNLSWSNDTKTDGYSFELSDDPGSIPDDTQDSNKTSVTYRDVTDGIHYFHIKGISGGNWGGTTHFAVKVDTTEPAEFKIKALPSARTTRRQPILEFQTTDRDSGVSHYEVKLVPLSGVTDQSLFIEASSPYVSQELNLGEYIAVVRAYDFAGNIRETSLKLNIVSGAFGFVETDGVRFGDRGFIAWKYFWLGAGAVLLLLALSAYRLKRRHDLVADKRQSRHLPDGLKKQLEELKRYRQKYGGLALFLLVSFGWFTGFNSSKAADALSTPTLTVLSEDMSNKDIFYAGGRVEIPDTQVTVYLQNQETQETYSSTVKPEKTGEWFYRHGAFLPSGKYSVWVQGKLEGLTSPPSGQRLVVVKKQALQLAGSRLSYEFLYGILFIIFAALSLFLLFYSLYHARAARKKQKLLAADIREAEDSIKRGFAVLRRDIEAELQSLQKSKGRIGREQKEREEQLLNDLKEVESKLEKEIWQMQEEIN